MHKTEGLVILYMKLTWKNNHLDKNDPWLGILAAVDLTVRSMCYIMLQATPIQMLFVHDMILNTLFIVYWEAVMRGKKNNK